MMSTSSSSQTISTESYERMDKDKISSDSGDFTSVVSQNDCLSAGTISSSVFNLIAATMGAGTITMPYIICRTGIALGTILTIMGAFLSYYSGMLLVSNREILIILDLLIQNSYFKLIDKMRRADWKTLLRRLCRGGFWKQTLADSRLRDNDGVPTWLHNGLHKPKQDSDSQHRRSYIWSR